MTLMTREDVLRELELLPVWQLREPLPSQMPLPSALEDIPLKVTAVENDSADVLPIVVNKLEPIDTNEVAVPEVSIIEEATIAVALVVEELITQETQQVEHLAFNHIASEDGAWIFVLPNAPLQADEALLMHNICKAMRIVVKPAMQIESLVDEMQIAQPKMMVVMGEATAQVILQSTEDLTSLRSKLHQFNGVTLVVTYDLATLLQNRLDKAKAWDDLRLAMSTLQNSEL
jgi:DNA polymerase